MFDRTTWRVLTAFVITLFAGLVATANLDDRFATAEASSHNIGLAGILSTVFGAFLAAIILKGVWSESDETTLVGHYKDALGFLACGLVFIVVYGGMCVGYLNQDEPSLAPIHNTVFWVSLASFLLTSTLAFLPIRGFLYDDLYD